MISTLVVTLIGCSSEGNAEQESDEKSELVERVNELRGFFDRSSKDLGYLDVTDYIIVANEANLLAGSLNLEERLSSDNSGETIELMLENIETAVGTLSDNNAKEVKESIKLSKVVYEEIFKEDYEKLLNKVDVKSNDNSLKSFVNNINLSNYDYSDWNNDLDYAKEGIHRIENHVEVIRFTLDKYGNNFSASEKV